MWKQLAAGAVGEVDRRPGAGLAIFAQAYRSDSTLRPKNQPSFPQTEWRGQLTRWALTMPVACMNA